MSKHRVRPRTVAALSLSALAMPPSSGQTEPDPAGPLTLVVRVPLAANASPQKPWRQ